MEKDTTGTINQNNNRKNLRNKHKEKIVLLSLLLSLFVVLSLFSNKKNYVVNILTLKLYLEQGLILDKINKVI